jgi:uncharacterized protein (DUF2236 family)
MEYFVEEGSIVRKIWGRSDIILFIFGGSAAEFALNKAVDWLYFTGKLPSDPLGRLFSTVTYARKIVFSPATDANRAIDSMRQIHSSVEQSRGYSIPEWAYRDVLFMLIHYSIASFELLERKLSAEEKAEVYDVFFRVGKRMGLTDLPAGFSEWIVVRDRHLQEDLEKTIYTINLFQQYSKHLGPIRFRILIEAQKMIVPERVKKLLAYSPVSLLAPVVPVYRLLRKTKLDRLIKHLLVPVEYRQKVFQLDMQ